jgi:biotin carboxylase
VSTVLILGGSVSQLPAIRQARASGLRVVVADGDRLAVGFAEADIAELIDFSDIDALVEVARRHGVDGFAAIGSDRAVAAAAAAADRLGLPGIGTAVAHRMTDKAAMREQLARRAIPQPPFAVVRTLGDASRALAEIGVPAVLKPVDSGGQRGVFRIERQGDLVDLLPRTLAFSRSGSAMLEHYVDGEELNAIAVARSGEVEIITLSDRLRPPGAGFGVGWIHRFPSSLAAATLARAASVALRAVQALGLRDGIAFPQLLARDGDVFVVEVAARVPAGQMADLVYHAVGVDLIEIALRQALGRPVGDELVEVRESRPAVIRFFTANPGILPTGRVLSIDGLEQVRDAPGVLDADLYLQVGETIRPVQVDADRRGYVVATGPSTDAALASATRAMRRLVVLTEEHERPGAGVAPGGSRGLSAEDAASPNA